MADPSDIQLPDPPPAKSRDEQLAPQRVDDFAHKAEPNAHGIGPDMPGGANPDYEAPQPLAPHEQAEMSHLLGKADRTPEEHDRLAELHSMASDYVDSWKADPQAAAGHMVDLFSMFAAALGHLSAVMPALGGIAPIVQRISGRVNDLKNAVFPPTPPPELPPAPEDGGMTQDEKAGAEGTALDPGMSADAANKPAGDVPDASVPDTSAPGDAQSFADVPRRRSPAEAAAAVRSKT